MIERENVSEVVVARKGDSVLEVSRILRDTQARHLIVVDEGDKPIGIISTVDVNNRIVAEEKNPKEVKAEDMMTKPIETIDLSSEYHIALEKMTGKGTYSLPVTENGKLIGQVEFSTCMRKAQEAALKKKEEGAN